MTDHRVPPPPPRPARAPPSTSPRQVADDAAATPRRSGSTCSPARSSTRCTTSIRQHKVTYDEYDALKAWLISVGEDGEWPLFLDVWVEHVVEEVANEHREGNKGTIEGPYYVPGRPRAAPRHAARCATTRTGTPLTCPGTVTVRRRHPARRARRSSSGTPTTTASTRSSPRASRSGTCAARSRADDDGAFEIHTIQPAPYQIPTDGSCGELIAAAGWHAWRPAHLHLKVSAPGPRAAHHPALLPRRRAHRRRHRPGGEARADPRPDARRPTAAGVTVHVRLRPRPRRLSECCSPYGWTCDLPPDLDPVRRAEICWPGRRRTARSCSGPASGAHIWRCRRRVRQPQHLRRRRQRGAARDPAAGCRCSPT